VDGYRSGNLAVMNVRSHQELLEYKYRNEKKMMKIRNATLLGILLLSGRAPFAQESAPKVKFFGEDSYLRFNRQFDN